MELSSFVRCLIIIFIVVGTDGNSTVSDTCAEYIGEYCKCNVVDHQVEETPLKMCSYKKEGNELCEPCRDTAQDNVTCAECPELACPACNISSTGLTYEPITFSAGEDEQENSRGKRYSIAHKWCRIENELLSGRFRCRAWRDRKECVLQCSEGDTHMQGYSFHFMCDRQQNHWGMELKPCEDTGRQMSGMGMGMGMPINRIIAGPGHNLRVFMPIAQQNMGRYPPSSVGGWMEEGDPRKPPQRTMGSYHRFPGVHHEEQNMGRYPPSSVGGWMEEGDPRKPPQRTMRSYHRFPGVHHEKRSYTDLPPVTTSSSDDFDFDGEDVISYTQIPPLELYDYNLLDPGSWMMANESSISYAPYKEVSLEETMKEKPVEF